jgi:hypothetical protein
VPASGGEETARAVLDLVRGWRRPSGRRQCRPKAVATALLYRRTKTSLVGLVSQISTVWANGNWVGGDGKISKRNQNVAMAFGLGERFGPKSKWAAEIRFGI